LSRRHALSEAIRIAGGARHRVHLVNGIWAEPAFAAALGMLGRAGSQIAIHSEAPDFRYPPTVIKKILRKGFGKWVARRAAGLFAVSHFAADFYTQLGFDPEQIYPFGYFREGTDLASEFSEPKNPLRTEIVYVGQLTHRKGVDILLAALRPLFAEHQALQLTVIGSGEEADALKKQVAHSGLADRVIFAGARSSDEIPRCIARADVLVLPSRWDGWGMVVNEALAVGVPVIVSDRCGAMDLIQPGINGFIFRSEAVDDLRQTFGQFLEHRNQWPALQAAAQVTGAAVSAASAAHYLIECLQHITGLSEVRPVPPWTRLPLSQSSEL
jgi:glycosyltransferase involved in cell wall biosynthesis